MTLFARRHGIRQIQVLIDRSGNLCLYLFISKFKQCLE